MERTHQKEKLYNSSPSVSQVWPPSPTPQMPASSSALCLAHHSHSLTRGGTLWTGSPTMLIPSGQEPGESLICKHLFLKPREKQTSTKSPDLSSCVFFIVYSLHMQGWRGSWWEDDGDRSPGSCLNHLGVHCAGRSAIPMLNKNCSRTYYS